MKIITLLQTLTISAVLISGTTLVNAASHAAAMPAAKQDMAKSNLPTASAEVRKIDLENKKITLKHGEIKNLDMPGMTMVFQVKDAAMLDGLKTGDKVQFTADKVNGSYTVMRIEMAK